MPKRRSPSSAKPRSYTRRKTGRWWKSLFVFGLKCLIVIIPAILLASVYVDSVVRNKFEGRKWAIPAKVYARPLELYPGQPFTAKGMADALTVLGYQPAASAGNAGQYHLAGNSVELKTRGFAYADQPEPSRWVKLDFDSRGISRVVEQNGSEQSGHEMTLLRLEPLMIGSLYPGEHEDRILIKLEEMPPVMLAGLVATEDRYFMDHHGISIRGVARAMWTNIA